MYKKEKYIYSKILKDSKRASWDHLQKYVCIVKNNVSILSNKVSISVDDIIKMSVYEIAAVIFLSITMNVPL